MTAAATALPVPGGHHVVSPEVRDASRLRMLARLAYADWCESAVYTELEWGLPPRTTTRLTRAVLTGGDTTGWKVKRTVRLDTGEVGGAGPVQAVCAVPSRTGGPGRGGRSAGAPGCRDVERG